MLSRDTDLCYGLMLMVCIKKLEKKIVHSAYPDAEKAKDSAKTSHDIKDISTMLTFQSLYLLFAAL